MRGIYRAIHMALVLCIMGSEILVLLPLTAVYCFFVCVSDFAT